MQRGSVKLLIILVPHAHSYTVTLQHQTSNVKMSSYAVIGARGGTGKALVKALLTFDTTAKVRAIVRDPSVVTADWITNEKVELIKGDVTNPTSLDFSNTDTVFFAASGKGYDLCQKVDRDGVLSTAKQCQKDGVRRMVLISSGLVDPINRWNFIRGILNTINTGLFHSLGMMDFKFEGENLLRSSGQEYTIIRPGRLGDDARDLTKAVPGVGQTNGGFLNGSVVDRELLAYVAIEAATSEHTKNVTFELGTKPPATLVEDTTSTEDMFSTLVQDNKRTEMESTTCGQ